MISVDGPDIPEWLNEGIASMAESGSLRTPRDNWRLIYVQTDRELQRAYLTLTEVISGSSVPPRHPLVLSSYYRYFLMYLNEKGVLGQVYTRFRNLSMAEEPNAPPEDLPVANQLQAIAEILGRENPDVVQRDFWRWLSAKGMGRNNSYNSSSYKQLVYNSLTNSR